MFLLLEKMSKRRGEGLVEGAGRRSWESEAGGSEIEGGKKEMQRGGVQKGCNR